MYLERQKSKVFKFKNHGGTFKGTELKFLLKIADPEMLNKTKSGKSGYQNLKRYISSKNLPEVQKLELNVGRQEGWNLQEHIS